VIKAYFLATLLGGAPVQFGPLVWMNASIFSVPIKRRKRIARNVDSLEHGTIGPSRRGSKG
jgi:hypothetical protein